MTIIVPFLIKLLFLELIELELEDNLNKRLTKSGPTYPSSYVR